MAKLFRVDPTLDLLMEEITTAGERGLTLGIKHDAGKARYDLIPPQSLRAVVDVFTFGARKYDAHNWMKGINYSRLLAAIHRHLSAIEMGEDIDKESKLPHAAHITASLFMLMYFQHTQRDELDDRQFKDSNI